MKSVPSVFQLIVLAVFIVLGIVGVILFAGFGGVTGKKIPQATIWGTIPETQMSELIRQLNVGQQVIDAKYTQIPLNSFQEKFVNALAEGAGPDIVLISDDQLYAQQAKLMTIPYTSYDARTYSDTFLNASDHFLKPTGIIGIPFSVDPIVMYYNRSMFATAGIAEAPKTWKELESIVPKIARINETRGIVKAGVALGESRNIANAKELLVTMLLQTGNTVTAFDSVTGMTTSVMDQPGTSIELPAVSVLDFYTRFSNPVSPVYTWSRSMPDSKLSFVSGDLAMYFGYASEFESIRLKNPNLDFDVVTVPQYSSVAQATYGKIHAFSIVKNSKNPQEAFSVINILTNPTAQQYWVDISRIPPARRDLLSKIPTDKYLATFYLSAIQARTWADPNPVQSNGIFRDMIETVTTGLAPAADAVMTAKQRLDILLQGITS